MYWTNIKDIEIPFLHDAAIVCEKIGHKLRSIYVDCSGECAISYWGDLSLESRARVLQNYLPDDVSFEDCYAMVQNRHNCHWTFDKQYPNGYTIFYTPDGINYKTL